MKKVSIEYAHIYTNTKINEEHDFSVEILSTIYLELGLNLENSSLVVMVDDYSFPDPTFNYEELSVYLKNKGFAPNLILRESQLIPLCDEVLANVKDCPVKSQIIDYIKSKKYPCSLFIATWYLLRLGAIKSSIFDQDLCSEKVLNILPESFQPFEEKAIEIIKNTNYQVDTSKIENRYFGGRLIA